MDISKTVLFSDLDATLFNSRGEVSAENRSAIARYMARGGKFAISTGRQPDNAMWFLRENFTNAPSVVLNGAAVYDFTTGEYIRRWYLDREALDPILDQIMAEIPRLDLQLYTDRGICYITPEDQAQKQMLELHRPCEFVTPESQRGKNIFKCLLFTVPAWEPRLVELLNQGKDRAYRLIPGTTDVGGKITYYELLPLGVSKGTAITALRDEPGLAGRTFFAVGDYWNDYELLQAADVAVAPSNAIDEVKAICQYVTVSNNEHAIAKILEEIIPSI